MSHVTRGTAARPGRTPYVPRRTWTGKVFDEGEGPAIVVIPGLHGRWEWSRPMLRRLASRCRVISYSLSGDIGSGRRVDPALGFDNHLRQLDEVLDAAGIERAAICGVSFGGFVALRYAATRPQRVAALVLASAPAPGWAPTAQQARWIARPWISTPAFLLTSPGRVWPEVMSAFDTWRDRVRFMALQGLRVLRAPLIPSLMSARILEAQQIDFTADCARVAAPALVVSGEEPLDRVVPPHVTRRYASMIPGARYQMLTGTGHLGSLTQPARFADVVAEFVHASRR
jgi:pimeloyl-ACP methyl ester carboxylesterase